MNREPKRLALFEKRIDGDDALLRLAALRFRQNGLGVECHVATPADLDRMLTFRPTPEAPVAAHLPRDFQLLDPRCRSRIMEFAAAFRGRVFALVVHDQWEAATHPSAYLDSLREVAQRLDDIPDGPVLFLEYAVGLDLPVYLHIFESLRDHRKFSACVDVGHVAVREARSAFFGNHQGADLMSGPSHPEGLQPHLDDVRQSIARALDGVLETIRHLTPLGKPLHLHLHDGHPFHRFGPYGLSDHLGFLDPLPIPSEFRGKGSLDPMFGPIGLFRIVHAALQGTDPQRVSFCLEIHPTEGRLPVGDASHLFTHWEDPTNAERMNFWLETLARNHRLLEEAIRSCPVDAPDDRVKAGRLPEP